MVTFSGWMMSPRLSELERTGTRSVAKTRPPTGIWRVKTTRSPDSAVTSTTAEKRRVLGS